MKFYSEEERTGEKEGERWKERTVKRRRTEENPELLVLSTAIVLRLGTAKRRDFVRETRQKIYEPSFPFSSSSLAL